MTMQKTMQDLGKVQWVAAAGLAAVLCSGAAQAKWVVQPTAEVRVESSDNIALRNDGLEDGGLVSSATLQANVINRGERTQATGTFGISFVDYSGVEDNLQDDNVPFVNLAIRRGYERGNAGVNISGRRDSLFRRFAGINDPFQPIAQDDLQDGLDDLDNGDLVNQGIVTRQIDRIRLNVSPYAQFTLNDRSNLRVTYAYSGEDYEDEDLAAAFGAQGYDSHSLVGQYTRAINQRTRFFMTARGTFFTPDRAQDTDAYETLVGIRRDLSERSNLSVQVGANRISPDVGDDETGVSAGLTYSRQFTNGLLRVDAQRTVQPNSFGLILETNRLSMNYQYLLSSRLAATMRVAATSTDTSQENNSQERDFVSFTPELSYSLTENWQVTAGYQYRYRDVAIDSENAKSNAVFLSMRYSPRLER